MLSFLLSFRRPTTKHTRALSEETPCYLHSRKHDKFLTTQQVITSLYWIPPSTKLQFVGQYHLLWHATVCSLWIFHACTMPKMCSAMTWVLGRTMVTTSNSAVLRRMVQLHLMKRLGHQHTIAPTSSLESTM